MKAVILAAGYATRLRPYTLAFPKTLLRVAGKPLLDSTIRAIARAPEISSAVLVTNARHHRHFLEWQRRTPVLASADLDVSVLDDGTASNEERLGSIGDLLFAMDRDGEEDDLLVICSDKMFSFRLSAFCAYAAERGGVANTYEEVEDPEELSGRHGCLVMGEDRRVCQFLEKPEQPPSPYKSIAFYIYPRETLSLIRRYAESAAGLDAPGHLSEWLCRQTPMFGWPIDGECLDVGNPQSYREVNRLYWQRQKGVDFREARVLVRAEPFAEERLEFLLAALEAEPNVTMIWLEVPSDRRAAWQARLEQTPFLVPVNLVERSPSGVGERAADLDCNWVFGLEPGVAEFDFSELGSEAETHPRVVALPE